MKTAIKLTALIALTASVLLSGHVLAQDAPPIAGPFLDISAPPPVATDPLPASEPKANGNGHSGVIEMPTGVDPTMGATTKESDQGNLITIQLDNVPMEDVVRMFTKISKANIISSSTNLTGNVSANLTDVHWRVGLNSILEQNELALVEKPKGSGVYVIVNRLPDAPDPMIVKTLFLDHATTDDIMPVLSGMIPAGGGIQPFSSRNALVVRTTEDNFSEITNLVATIDIPSKQVCIETQFIELNDEASKKIGLKWDSLDEFGAVLSVGPFSRTETLARDTTRDDSFARTDTKFTADQAHEGYTVDDEQLASISDPEARLMTATAAGDAAPPNLHAQFSETALDAGSTLLDSFAQSIQQQQAAILEVDSLNFVLSALEKMDGVTIVSNPKIIVTSGFTNAVFRVGRREPIIKQELSRGTADSPGDKITANLDTTINTDSIAGGFVRTGIELKVLPTVKTDQLIEALIDPRLTRKIGEKSVAGNSWPIIAVKEIMTKFTLRSGQTVAIGGLTDSSNEKRTTRIPLLGRIPLIGKYLFSHSETVTSQVETIIFVSLSLAEPQNMRKNDGIPETSVLVYPHLRKQRAQIDAVRREIESMEEAEAANRESQADRVKAMLKKDSE